MTRPKRCTSSRWGRTSSSTDLLALAYTLSALGGAGLQARSFLLRCRPVAHAAIASPLRYNRHGRLPQQRAATSQASQASLLSLAMTRGPVSREPPSPSDQTDQWSALTVPPSKVMPAFWHDGLQTRPRLTDYLELLIRRQRLCLLCAPAGYGKTVLMADLGRQCRLPQVWLRLTNEDRDPTGLAHSLRAAVDRVLADDVDGPGGRLWATAAADSRIQMAVLAHRLSRPPREWVLFLDDLQVLEGSGRAWVVLGDFLRSLAEHVHVVAASRLPLPGELLELFGAHRIATLGTAELSFTQDEAEAHLAAQAVPVADWDRRLELFELYEGWPAAVSLLLEPSVLTQAEGQDGVAQAKQLFERLAAQLVASLQAEERAFLERIAQLERITVPLCQECLTVGDAEAMLERLVRRNVLLDGPDQRGEYRLHRLFRQYVLASAGEKSSLPAEQHRRAASSLRAAGDLLGASRHIIAAGEHVQAEELLAEACQDLARAGQFRVMLDLLARWQTAAGRDLPARLAHWQAHAMYFVGDWRGAVAEASRALSDPTIDDAARASLLAIRSYARGKRGDVGGGLADIELVLAIGSGSPGYDRLAARFGRAAGESAAACRRSGETGAGSCVGPDRRPSARRGNAPRGARRRKTAARRSCLSRPAGSAGPRSGNGIGSGLWPGCGV